MKTIEEAALDEVYSKIRPDIIETINNYITKGWHPGSFVEACLANDLMGAFGKADYHNVKTIKEICCYIYNEIPANSHGSYEKIDEYLRSLLDANVRGLK